MSELVCQMFVIHILCYLEASIYQNTNPKHNEEKMKEGWSHVWPRPLFLVGRTEQKPT